MKNYFIDWRAKYPESYQQLLALAENPQNVTSQVRQIILGYDPYRGQTELQDQAMKDLEIVSIKNKLDKIEKYCKTILGTEV